MQSIINKVKNLSIVTEGIDAQIKMNSDSNSVKSLVSDKKASMRSAPIFSTTAFNTAKKDFLAESFNNLSLLSNKSPFAAQVYNNDQFDRIKYINVCTDKTSGKKYDCTYMEIFIPKDNALDSDGDPKTFTLLVLHRADDRIDLYQTTKAFFNIDISKHLKGIFILQE
ncbi:MAG: hypothetical protein V4629_11490 [Pseudomonadota bacterium]